MMTSDPAAVACGEGGGGARSGAELTRSFLSDSGQSPLLQHIHTGDCSSKDLGPLSSGPISPGSEPGSVCLCLRPPPGTWRPLPAVAPSEQCPLSHCLYPSNHWVSLTAGGFSLKCCLGFFIPAERVTGNQEGVLQSELSHPTPPPISQMEVLIPGTCEYDLI